jgi:hypothetical protein
LNQKVDKILHVGETADGERYIFITEIFGKHKKSPMLTENSI